MSDYYIVSFAHENIYDDSKSFQHVIGIYDNIETAIKVKTEAKKFLDLVESLKEHYNECYYDCVTIQMKKYELELTKKIFDK